MQSLSQAVYSHVCAVSRSSAEGVGKRELIHEMVLRGYLPPIRERVNGALREYMGMGRVVKVNNRYVHRNP